MSRAENTQVVAGYESWSVLPDAVVRANAATVYKESHRLPDVWNFEIRDEGLYDPTREGYVHDLVKQFPHPNLYLRGLEDNIITAMDSWALSEQKGIFVWISPTFAGYYPTNKIEILQKSADGKVTNNIVVLFDGSSKTCLAVAKALFPELDEIKTPEELRNSVVLREQMDMNFVWKTVAPFIPKHKKERELSEETLDYIVSLARNGAEQELIASEMERLGVIGEFSFSCPGINIGLMGILDSSSLIIGATEDEYGSLKFVCPHCGVVNTRPHGQLISNCQFCGGDVKC